MRARRDQRYAANSTATQQRIREVYGKDAPVIPPPLPTGHLPGVPTTLPASGGALMICRLLPYKRVDLAIEACARAEVPLTVAGEGPDEVRLRELAAGKEVTFLGRVADADVPGLFETHRAA